jgi:hypothetical protein
MMGTEILVASLCLGDWACSDALKAYYQYRPEIKEFKNQAKNVAERNLGEAITFIVPAAILATTSSTYQIRIYKDLSLQKKDEVVGFNYEFRF